MGPINLVTLSGSKVPPIREVTEADSFKKTMISTSGAHVYVQIPIPRISQVSREPPINKVAEADSFEEVMISTSEHI